MKKNVLLVFNSRNMYEPIIYRLVKDYDIVFNVQEARISPKQEGRIILELSGTGEQMKKAMDYLNSSGVHVELLSKMVKKNEEKCTHCGACTAVCRPGALHIERPSMKVLFNSKVCTACGLCKKACPFGAMTETDIEAQIEGSVQQTV